MAQITHFDQGDIWPTQATFTVNGVATDPTTVTVKVKNPSGTITTVGPVPGSTGGSGITRVSAGVYTYPVTLDDVGYWFTRYEGTGTATATEELQAIVDPSEFYGGLSTRALVTLAETKDWLNQQNIDTSNDLDLVRVINDVSDRIHLEAEREFKPNGTNPQTRIFEAPIGGHSDPWYVDGQWMGNRDVWRRTINIGDLASLTSLQILNYDWTTVAETVTSGNMRSIYADSPVRTVRTAPWQPITHIHFQTGVTYLNDGMLVSVTGNWGFPAVPGNIRQAVLDTVASVMDRDVEHYRQDLSTPQQGESGTVVMVGAGSSRLLSLPPSAAAAAWSYRLPNVA